MRHRTLDEMISYFNQQVSEMDIDRKYKIALLGMITAIGYENKKQERKWETCFDCPLSHGCPKINECTNEQAEQYAGEIPNDCPIEQPHWVSCSERLPEEAYPVILTWKNEDPASYYQYILGKHYVGVAHFKNGKWYWYSSVTEDVLMEYGRYDSEEFDEAIQPIAWMPLPEPYREVEHGIN